MTALVNFLVSAYRANPLRPHCDSANGRHAWPCRALGFNVIGRHSWQSCPKS